jgi:hypothetical protein
MSLKNDTKIQNSLKTDLKNKKISILFQVHEGIIIVLNFKERGYRIWLTLI